MGRMIVMQRLKWVLKHPRRFLISRLHRRWIVEPYEYIQILAEKKIHEYIQKDKNDIRVIFVIGAYLGFEIKKLLKNFPNSEIYAFEPHPIYFAELAKKYSNSNRVFLFQISISEREGTALFYNNTGDGTGSLLELNSHSKEIYGLMPTTSIVVATTTLDAWCKTQFGHIPNVDLIWIDVQGAENKVISGGGETLSKTQSVFIEVSQLKPIGQSGALLQEIQSALMTFGLVEVSLGLDSLNLTGNAIYTLQRS